MMSISEILELSTTEKILLVEQIWDSINANELSVTEAQKLELDNRITADNAGEMAWHSWEEVKAHLKSKRG